MKRFFLAITAAGMLCTGTMTLSAQEGRIQQRKENQQARIAEGVENGSLSPKETANLEHKEGALNKEIRHDRKQNGGNLTNKEKAQINRQQNVSAGRSTTRSTTRGVLVAPAGYNGLLHAGEQQ